VADQLDSAKGDAKAGVAEVSPGVAGTATNMVAAGVTPSALRAHELPRQLLRGLEEGATNRLLERAAKTIDGLGNVVAALRGEIEELRSARDEAQRKLDGALDGTGVHRAVGEVLVTAHKAAETVRAEAERQAEQLVAEAETEARSRSESLVVEAEQANEAVARARQEAAVAIEEAERRAAELVDAARAEREQLLASAVSEAAAARAGLEAESERLRAGIEMGRSRWAAFLREALAQVEELSAVAPANEQDESERPEESLFTTELRERLTTVAAPTESESPSEQP
jgi:cell division septum initiation protein DivIVA